MEIGFEGVFPAVLLHDHPFVLQYGNEVCHPVSAKHDTDRGVGFPQYPFEFLVAVFVFQGECRFQCDAVLLLGDILVRVEFPPPFARLLLLELIAVQQFGQCLLIDTECG